MTLRIEAVSAQAEGMMSTAASLVSLRIPPHVQDREGVVHEAALTICLNSVLECAHENARPAHAMMHLAVLRGREAGMNFSEIMESMHAGLIAAVTARAAEEAEGEGEPPPSGIIT